MYAHTAAAAAASAAAATAAAATGQQHSPSRPPAFGLTSTAAAAAISSNSSNSFSAAAAAAVPQQQQQHQQPQQQQQQQQEQQQEQQQQQQRKGQQQQQEPLKQRRMERVRDAARVVKNREKLVKWMTTHQTSAWTGLFLVVFLVYHLFSDGDFSFLMTVSSLVSTFSFLMVVYKIEVTRSCAGVSLRMIECYVVLLFSRLCSIVPYEGYLPYDRSGDWLYQTLETLSLLFSALIVYQCRRRYAATYEASSDTFAHAILFGASFFLALLFHPSLNAFMPADA
ncbi:hypothetical protein Efla_007127 [Eimeria flavescens]